MCSRQKTESSLLDGCHNMLLFRPEVVRIVLPCKKRKEKKKCPLMCIFQSKQCAAHITHVSFRSLCIKLLTNPLLLCIVSLSTTTTATKLRLETLRIHNKEEQAGLKEEEALPVPLAVSAPRTALQQAEISTALHSCSRISSATLW